MFYDIFRGFSVRGAFDQTATIIDESKINPLPDRRPRQTPNRVLYNPFKGQWIINGVFFLFPAQARFIPLFVRLFKNWL